MINLSRENNSEIEIENEDEAAKVTLRTIILQGVATGLLVGVFNSTYFKPETQQ